MKITFIDRFDEKSTSTPFAVYYYNEGMKQYDTFINLKDIVNQHARSWFADVETSYAQLSQKFSSVTRWWWVTPASRLDVRPWAQEYLFKALFFARALIQWIEANPKEKEIVLIGCPSFVAMFLRDFQKDLIIEGKGNRWTDFFLISAMAIKNLVFDLMRLIKHAFFIIKGHHFPRTPKDLNTKNLVLYNITKGADPSEGHEYYFGSLFKDIEKDVDITFCPIMSEVPIKDGSFKGESSFLMDNLKLGDILYSIQY